MLQYVAQLNDKISRLVLQKPIGLFQNQQVSLFQSIKEQSLFIFYSIFQANKTQIVLM